MPNAKGVKGRTAAAVTTTTTSTTVEPISRRCTAFGAASTRKASPAMVTTSMRLRCTARA